MTVALVLVSIAFLVCLGMLLFGSKNAAPVGAKSEARPAETETAARRAAEAEAEKRKKEADELKHQVSELKDQLKQAKRKLYEQKEADKEGRDLQKARANVEREASAQLDFVRTELAHTLTELERLRAETQRSKGRPAPEAPAPAAAAAPAAVAQVEAAKPTPAPAPEVKRVIRELSPADKERIERLESQAAKDRQRAVEAEREMRKLKNRADTQNRVYVVTKGELELVKDKFKALEKRLNRTLLERDLMRRAIKDLEQKSGLAAGQIELSPEEVARSDSETEAKQKAAAEASAPAPAPVTEASAETAVEAPSAESSAEGSPSTAPLH